MRQYTATLRLSGPLSEAVAVEWTDQPAPLDSGQGWEPCLGLPDGAWRFSSHDPSVAAPPHRRGPGVFGNLAIRCRLSAAGPWTAVSEDRKEIVILDAEDDPAPPSEAPRPVSAPSLAGTGRIGTEVAVAPGLWSGVPAPRLSFQWRRDGTPIPEAVGRTYVPGPADDRTALDCRVAARNALGEASALTPALPVSWPAPAAVAELPEAVFDQAPGTRLVETESAFAGANLAFSAAGATIDPRTGALTVSTEAAVSGRTVTVTATNSGGSASARLDVTVRAVPPRTLAAADVQILRSVWRPLGQSVSFTPVVAFPGLAGEAVEAIQWTAATALDVEANWHPCAARPGEAGAFDLLATGHPLPAGATDPALFAEVDAARLSRLRFRWRRTGGSLPSAASVAFTVPLPAVTPTPAVAGTGVRSPNDAALAWAAGQGYMTFDVAAANETRATTNDQATHHAPLLLALAAHAGNARSYAGAGATLSPAAWTRGQIAHWVGGASTTANDNAPAAFGGYTAQYEATCAAVIAVARRTPAVWDGLTAAQRTRCDLLMRGLLVSSVWCTSDDNPYIAGGSQASQPERDMRGYPCGRDFNANFSLPMALVAYVCAGYLGVSAADAFLRGFDRAAFAAELGSAGGFWDMWNTFRQNWTSNTSPGPTAAQLELTCRGPLVNGARTGFRTRGVGLSGLMTIVDRELGKMWNGVIRPGFQRSPGNYGVPEDTAAGRLTNVADFAGLPNEGLTGQAQELQSSDADGSRSSMDYGHHGFQAALAMLAALAVQGVLPLENADMIDIGNRMNRGVADLRYKSERGYVDYRRGSRDTRNGEWSISRRAAWGLPHLYSGWEDAMRPWFFQPRPSAAPAVTGTARVGQTLTGTVGSWASNHGSAISLSRQWEEETSAGVWSGIGTATAGTANATYSPTAGNVGRRLRLRVTATNGVTSTTAWSAPTAAVTAA